MAQKYRCYRCGTKFNRNYDPILRVTYNYPLRGSVPYDLCDECTEDLQKFMKGHLLKKSKIVSECEDK